MTAQLVTVAWSLKPCSRVVYFKLVGSFFDKHNNNVNMIRCTVSTYCNTRSHTKKNYCNTPVPEYKTCSYFKVITLFLYLKILSNDQTFISINYIYYKRNYNLKYVFEDRIKANRVSYFETEGV